MAGGLPGSLKNNGKSWQFSDKITSSHTTIHLPWKGGVCCTPI